MAINVADNFSYKGGKPLDARIKYDTITAMVNTPTADLYDGCLAYVTAEKKNYQYDSSNAVDQTLGKWRELETGGGGATYTAGDGIDITNNVISVGEMPDTDMSEVVTPLPSVMSRRFTYSTEEQVVGTWIDGKPIYQKVFELQSTLNISNSTWTDTGLSASGVAAVINAFCLGGAGTCYPLMASYTAGTGNFTALACRGGTGSALCDKLIIQYTKS